ncbi:MAG: hypothetical protein PUD88_01845, partial [Prevotellaceae bacterium]|nr:hypothetical protein [Prevotellaceae bacterium]
MKKFTIKSLLIAAALCLGTSAWADTFDILYGVPTYDSDGLTITSVTTQSDFTGDANEKTGVAFADGNNNSAVFPISGSVLFANTSSAWTKYFSSEVTKGKVYFSCIYSVSANSAGTWKILGNDDKEIFVSMNGSNRNNGNYDYATICGTGISGYVRQPRTSGYGVDICIDLDTRVITYSLTRSSGNGSYSTDKGTISIPVEFTSVKGLSVSKTNYGAYMDNVMLYSQVSEIKKYSYTINYKLGEDIIKTVQANAPKGEVITAEKSFDSNGVKYYVDADPLPTMTISENEKDNVLNVNVREAETWNYTVMSNVGNYKVTGTAIEGENVSVAFPRLINVDGTLYTSNTANNKECLYTFNMDAANKVATIDFTATDITGVVFFSEAENIEGLTADNGGQAGSRSSMKQGAYATVDTEITTLQSGKYKISGARSGNTGVTFAFVVNGATVSQATTSGSWGTFDGAEFNLVEEATIVLKAAGQGGTNSRTLDYIYIQKTDEATTKQNVTVGINGIATFTPSVALDFTNATSIKAYTATVSETTVTLTETKTVAAGEGVIIKSVNGSE